MKTSWENSGLSQDQQSDIGLQLREMEKDGLVKLTDDEVTITQAGRPFVRNVCMAFDHRMKRSEPQRQIFSMTI